jgi:hypothetical protein
MQRKDLPEDFAASAFRTRDAIAAGVSRDRLQASDLFAPYPGVRAPAASSVSTLRDRRELLLPRLESHQFFSHTTGADVYGAPLPAHLTQGDLHVGAIPPGREPRIAGVIGHRMSVGYDELTLVNGMPVPVPAEVFAQLGVMLTVDDLVCVADYLLGANLVDLDDLREAADIPRRRGAVALRDALLEARSGSESPRETKTRLILVRGGLPQPELNWTLRDRAGAFVARLDMAYPEYRVCVEYDGRHHADTGQFARDADRWAAIEAEGWILVRVLSHHLAQPNVLVTRARRALASGGWVANAR